MNNPNDVIDESDGSSSDDSSDYDERLLTANVGLLYESKFNENEKLFDDTKRIDYEEFRNKYFTPELTKRKFTINHLFFNTEISLKNTIKLPNDNIIGFKLYKSYIKKTANTDNTDYIDIIIDQIPEIVCSKNEHGQNIIDRIPLSGTDYYFYEDIKYDEIYFNPISIDKFKLNLSGYQGYLSFEITYLNI
tara:strand:+ start:19 stop:591 length:573 start_codon:yes stop_codon:yes gene_type:complete